MTDFTTIDISELNDNSFYHYTNINNLDSIYNNGLKPRIGDNAVGIEQNEKIFFTIGMTNSLILMESWIRWLIAKSGADMPGTFFDKPMYIFATTLLKIKIFQPLMTFISKLELKSKYRKVKAYKQLKQILDNSVYLLLNLEEGIDYSFHDIDEVKNQNFDRTLLSLMYNTNYINDNYMEFWNMHTFANKTIEPEKIKIVKVGNSIKASDVIEYMRKNSKIKMKQKLPFLYGYFKWLENYKQHK